MKEVKERIIQEFVPGKQVTLAHVIANPDPRLYAKLGLSTTTVPSGCSPSRPARPPSSPPTRRPRPPAWRSVSWIASRVRCCWSGTLSEVESALRDIVETLERVLGFAITEVTST